MGARKQRQRVNYGETALSFEPYADGSFLMCLDDEDTHVPRHLALEYYPLLSDVHDKTFGEGNWGASLPLSLETAPLGKVQVIAETLRKERSSDDLLKLFVVLTELGAVLQASAEKDVVDIATYKIRKDAERTVADSTRDVSDRHQAMAWLVAHEIVVVRELMAHAKERVPQAVGVRKARVTSLKRAKPSA
jgi:hypothetical protein